MLLINFTVIYPKNTGLAKTEASFTDNEYSMDISCGLINLRVFFFGFV